MTSRYWPLHDLRIRAGQLELKLPGPDELAALAELAADGVHDPSVQPFMVAWTDADPDARALGTMQFHWSRWASWRPANWSLELAVIADGTVVGTQGISAADFAVMREVGTGSWLGRRFQGQGIGSQMRAAVLAFAFDGLGAESAASAAFEDNPASLRVSAKLGYTDDGIARHMIRGKPATCRRLRLDRTTWEQHRGTREVTITGLRECLPMFGLDPS